MVWPRLVDSIFDWILANRVDLAAESWFSMIGAFTRIIDSKYWLWKKESSKMSDMALVINYVFCSYPFLFYRSERGAFYKCIKNDLFMYLSMTLFRTIITLLKTGFLYKILHQSNTFNCSIYSCMCSLEFLSCLCNTRSISVSVYLTTWWQLCGTIWIPLGGRFFHSKTFLPFPTV